tara:strand:- start:111 stop:1052 length:942 start_codon:yes stop_codon:yes gene_type:complete
MKYIILILSTTLLISAEMEVDGDLKVTGTIESSDSLKQRIAELELVILQLQAQIASLEEQMKFIAEITNYGDCFGIVGGTAVLDNCGICDGNCDGTGTCDEEDICGLCYGDSISIDECAVDIDGNSYRTIQIGEQIWMAENLRVTKYRDGTEIASFLDIEWASANVGAYYPPNGISENIDDYGLLYNNLTIHASNGLCMDGWHIPDEYDWLTLLDYVDYNGGKLKSIGTIEQGDGLWHTPNSGAEDTYGFSANPAGVIQGNNALFVQFGNLTYFWVSTNDYERAIKLSYDTIAINSGHHGLARDGFSVRCVKD